MNRSLLLRELRSNSTSLLVWTAIITFLTTATMSLYGIFLENNVKILAMISILPEGALQFKGVSDINDLFSVLGFYSANNVIYMLVLGSIYSISLSSNILLKEEYGRTAEFLLSWPVTRGQVFFSKLAVVVINILLINLVTAVAGYISLETCKKEPYNVDAFLIMSLYTLLLHFFFAALGLFISVLIKKPKPVTTLSVALVMVLYFVYTISNITPDLSWAGYVSPYKFIDLDVVNPVYRIDLINILYFTLLPFLLIFISLRIYLRKDIYL
ncbi:MAG: ABC transporter permease subunit [Bacteroidales bacterium]|nr:ABC transporter permease subunit [Bacteroidales bacterium]